MWIYCDKGTGKIMSTSSHPPNSIIPDLFNQIFISFEISNDLMFKINIRDCLDVSWLTEEDKLRWERCRQ